MGIQCNSLKIDNLHKNNAFIFFRIVKLNVIIAFVYFNSSTGIKFAMQEIDAHISQISQRFSDLKIIYAGDFNARIGNKGGSKEILIALLHSPTFQVAEFP